MSANTQFLETIIHQNVPALARAISARRVRPLARIALALALAVFGIWRSAWAEGPVQSYSIPAGSLEDALMELAAQAELKLIFKTDLVRSTRSAGLTGTLTPEQGVARLLEGSDIAYRFVDPNTVTIEPAAPVAPLERLVAEAGKPMEYAGATEPAPKKPKAPVGRSEYGPTVLPEMTVTATAYDETSYNAYSATTATRTDTPIFDTPVSVQVVPRAVLDDQQVIDLEGAVANVSGVQVESSYGGLFDIFSTRGFRLGSNVYRNGVRNGYFNFDPANTERLEILKGPASVLYGRIEPGGLINRVTKQPLVDPY
ncbi:MAG: TonB-dependent siderophore receptor, partial [Gammaproteobacteria bacterium]